MALAAFFGVSPTMAQTNDKAAVPSGGLEEIVVTATRREERLQDVAISVSAFSQEKMDAQGLKNIDDLARLAPGVAFSRNGVGSSANYNDENADLNIRGVDSAAGTSTVAVYLDDTPIQSRHLGFGTVNAFPALFDLERVEVLRGPQGTLFGASAEGGAVRFLTPSPSLAKFSGYDRAELSATSRGDPSYEAGVAAGGPIIENVLGFRLSASFRRDGGWVDRVGFTRNGATDALTPAVFTNTTEKASNWQQTATFRAALKWKVNEALSVTPSVYYQRLQINDTAAYWIELSKPSNGVYRNGNALHNPSTDPFWLAAVRVDYDLGFAQLISNSSYLSKDQHSTSDYTQFNRALYHAVFGNPPSTYPPVGAQGYAAFGDVQRNYYQEIRLTSKDDSTARLSWNAGVYFSHLNENVPEDIVDKTIDAETNFLVCIPNDAVLACPNGRIFHGPLNRVVDRQLAAFGEVTVKFSDSFKGTFGLRYSKLDYAGSIYQTGPFLGTTLQTTASASDKPLTPKLILSWQPTRDQLVYVSAAKGFRPGGPNTAVGTTCGKDLNSVGLSQAPASFASDSLWSYEVGNKSTFLDRRLQINASVFYIEWNNIQQNVYLPTCGEQFAANLGKAQSKGGEIELQFRPADALLMDFTAAYTDAKYTATACAGTHVFDSANLNCGFDTSSGSPVPIGSIVHKGDALIGAPWSYTAALEYHFLIGPERTPYVRLDYQYGTAQTKLLPGQDSVNGLNDTSVPGLPSTTNLALRAGLRFSGFDISLFSQNLTNSHPQLFKSRDIAADAFDQLYFGRGVRPRTFGLTASYRY